MLQAASWRTKFRLSNWLRNNFNSLVNFISYCLVYAQYYKERYQTLLSIRTLLIINWYVVNIVDMVIYILGNFIQNKLPKKFTSNTHCFLFVLSLIQLAVLINVPNGFLQFLQSFVFNCHIFYNKYFCLDKTIMPLVISTMNVLFVLLEYSVVNILLQSFVYWHTPLVFCYSKNLSNYFRFFVKLY